jgi:tetratricopeptide (TPR) repeat protein
MKTRHRSEEEVRAARQAIVDAEATPTEKAEMLMEIAMGLQQRRVRVEDLLVAGELYREAWSLCPPASALLAARIQSRLATALLAAPAEEPYPLEEARDVLETALATLAVDGSDAEIAEAEMNLGLALQALSGHGRARVQDAMAAYQRALRTFERSRHPREFAIIQNNLATAYLALPAPGESGRMREKLAVDAFEEGLRAVTLAEHPLEYAMLQNNLANALQYAESGDATENRLRALDAYDEALKVRTRIAAPGAYANTIANKANCLARLPDDPARPDLGAAGNLALAVALYHEAQELFVRLGLEAKAERVMEALAVAEAAMAGAIRRAV